MASHLHYITGRNTLAYFTHLLVLYSSFTVFSKWYLIILVFHSSIMLFEAVEMKLKIQDAIVIVVIYFIVSNTSRIQKILILFLMLAAFTAITSNFMEKLNGVYTSTSLRMLSLHLDFTMFLSSPFFGIGIEQYGKSVVSISRDLYGKTVGSSFSTISYSLALFGILGLVPILFHIASCSSLMNTKSKKVLLVLSLLLMLMSQSYLITPFIVFFSYQSYNGLRRQE